MHQNSTSSVIDLADPRTRRAIPIAAASGQWARVTNKLTGELGFAIPGSKPDVRYLVTSDSCSCPDQVYNAHLDCKHMLAVRIVEALA